MITASCGQPRPLTWQWDPCRHPPTLCNVVIETERLTLRPIELGEIDEFLALHEDPEVTRFLTSLNRAQALRRLEAAELEWKQRGHGMFSVRDRVTDRFLGRAGLKYWKQFDETEAGWVLRREVWGRGYATEAARACIDWGWRVLEVPYLTAMIQRENVRSIRVAERIGFSPMRTDTLLGEKVVVYALARQTDAQT